jgi:hypothetical protein
MNRRTLWITALGLGLFATPFTTSTTFAQERDRGDRGGFDMARFQEERLNRTKEQLGATDEDWQVLKPKIEKVFTAQAASFAGRGFGGRGRDGDRGRDSNRGPTSPAAQASRELRDALENKDTPPDQIVAKLAALREARAKARTELEAAQKDLQSVLTPRQEAVLVAAGTLE